LRIGTGGVAPTEIYFDNIVVTDLTPDPTITPNPTPPPPPTPTPFPYFSQTDPQWAKQKLDSSKYTIGSSGCALTSAAMILKSFGLDIIPWGNTLVDLNPGTLNDWLNLDHHRWLPDAGFNPSAITALSLALNSSGSVIVADTTNPNPYTKLEHSVLSPSPTYLNPVLTDKKHPLMFKTFSSASPSKVHFSVAYTATVSGSINTYSLNDPVNDSLVSLSIPPSQILRANYFYPTNSNFSYLYFTAYEPLHVMVSNPASQSSGVDKTGNIHEDIDQSNVSLENPLEDLNDPTNATGSSYWLTQIKYPQTGKYT
jgi:hypothetical protein